MKYYKVYVIGGISGGDSYAIKASSKDDARMKWSRIAEQDISHFMTPSP